MSVAEILNDYGGGMSRRLIVACSNGSRNAGMLELGHKEAWGVLWRIILASGVKVGRSVALGWVELSELASRITCSPVR